MSIEQAQCERQEVDALLDYLGSLDPLPGNPPIPPDTRHSLVRRFLLERLRAAMASEEAAVRCSSGCHTSSSYFARRVVAGWGQLLDLWEAGEEDAMSRAHGEGALIFRGAR